MTNTQGNKNVLLNGTIRETVNDLRQTIKTNWKTQIADVKRRILKSYKAVVISTNNSLIPPNSYIRVPNVDLG